MHFCITKKMSSCNLRRWSGVTYQMKCKIDRVVIHYELSWQASDLLLQFVIKAVRPVAVVFPCIVKGFDHFWWWEPKMKWAEHQSWETTWAPLEIKPAPERKTREKENPQNEVKLGNRRLSGDPVSVESFRLDTILVLLSGEAKLTECWKAVLNRSP